MPIPRAQKEENVELLRAELAEIPHAILVDFKGLDVAGATDLRRKLRDEAARLKVVKNSIALRAIEDLPLGELKDVFVGQTAIVYTEGDVVSLARTLRTFAKEFETPSFKGGIVDGALISEEDFEQLAQLPPREELIGKALYLMNYPIAGLATALNAILQSAVTVLDQIREKKEEAEAPAEAAEEAAEAPAEEAVEETAEEEPEEAAEEAAEAPAEAAEEVAEAPAEDAAEETAEAPAEDAVEETAEAEPQEAAEEVAEEPAEDEPAQEAAVEEEPAEDEPAEEEPTEAAEESAESEKEE